MPRTSPSVAWNRGRPIDGPDLNLKLRVDADGYPLVWADKDDDVVLVLLGEKGASAAGISATIAFPATTVRRWFRDVLVGLRRVLAELDESAEPT